MIFYFYINHSIKKQVLILRVLCLLYKFFSKKVTDYFGGHAPFQEEPQWFAEKVLSFIEGVENRIWRRSEFHSFLGANIGASFNIVVSLTCTFCNSIRHS
jgi:hypothetical protein